MDLKSLKTRQAIHVFSWPPFSWPWFTTRSQRHGLLRVLAVGIEEKLPLVPLLEAWGDDEKGVQQKRIQRLIRLLNQGVSLPDAVEQVPGILSDEEILAVRFDAQSGTTTTAIRDILSDTSTATLEESARFRSTKYYLWTVLLVGLPIIVFIEVKIFPEFRQIYREFALELPPVTEEYLWLSGMLENFAWLFLLLLIVITLTVVFTRPGRAIRNDFLRLFPFARSRRSAGLLRLIAIASGAGRPIAGALSTLARYHFDPALRHKLLYVRNEIEQGADLWQSMQAADLITNTDVRALQSAERLGNRPWVLTQLSLVKTRQNARRLDWMTQLLMPAVVMLLGVIVAFSGVALLSPLSKLIESLAM